MPVFADLRCFKTLTKHVVVGMGAASFWRGAWYVLDDNLFPDNPEASAASSFGLGVLGMAVSQGLVARAERTVTTASPKAWMRLRPSAARFGAIYTVAISCVLVWRGTWVGWDCLYERYVNKTKGSDQSSVASTDPGHATQSGILSHAVAVTLLLGAGLFSSVLAPPAAISVIRDLTVKGTSTYQGQAQVVMDQFLGRSGRWMPNISTRGMSAARSITRIPTAMKQHNKQLYQTLPSSRQSFTKSCEQR